MADCLIKLPCGEIEDIPIRVGNIFVPYDFVVMDMEENQHTTLIIGRESLKTMGAVISCKNNTSTCEVADEKIMFELSKTLKQPMVEKVWRVDLVESEIVHYETIQSMRRDTLYEALQDDKEMEKSREDMKIKVQLDEAHADAQDSKDELPLIQIVVKGDSSKPPPKIELKPLPSPLKYTFLENDCEYPFIVNDGEVGKTFSLLFS